MTTHYWYRECPVCGQGRLILMKDHAREALYLHCEECEWGWRDPENVNKESGFLTLLEPFPSSVATLSEIKAQGWEKYAVHSFEAQASGVDC